MKGYKSFLILLVVLNLVYGRRVQNPCNTRDAIPCDNGDCIRRTDWCDDEVECADQSDEKYCIRRGFDSHFSNNCTEKHFVCSDGTCIPISSRCDGEWDCFPSDDEEICDTIDQDESVTGEEETNYHHYTSAPPFVTNYPTLATSTDFYGRQTRRSSNRYYNSPNPPPPPTAYDYDYRNSHDYDYDNRNSHNEDYDDRVRYSQRGYNHRSSNTYPERQFTGYQQPNVPPPTPETPTRRTSHIQPTPRIRQDPTRPNYNYHSFNRESHIVHPPRTIVFPPRNLSPSSTRRTAKRPNYPHFHFAKNYTEIINYDYKRNVQNAKDWLLGQRDDSYTWGRDTPRALIALSLISNSFKSDVDDNELMKKSFESFLGLKLLRNGTGLDKISTTKLAVYINTLFATCQDPHNFFGIDLVDVLYETQNHLERNQKFVNPLIYLTLCLANKDVPIQYLQSSLRDSFPTEISKDLHILATTAMACLVQRKPYDSQIRAKLNKATESLLSVMNPVNGSFGSKYSTALAAQALMSVNISQNWNYQKTLDYLAQQQLPDGSFGDMQATYYTVLALSGRSLLHLRNTLCDPVGVDKKEWSPEDILNREGPRKSVSYILRVGYPETLSTGVLLSVPADTNFFDIMRVAAYRDSRFKFNYEYSRGQLGIHTIANIPNDPERGMFWTLYQLPRSSPSFDFKNRYTGDPGTLIPEDGDELVFWYLTDFLYY